MKIQLLLVLLLSGCATSSELYLANGQKGYAINCNGAANSISTCYEKAGELCGSKGYTLLDRDGEAHGFGIASGSLNANGSNAQGIYVSQHGAIVTRSMLVQCNEAK